MRIKKEKVTYCFDKNNQPAWIVCKSGNQSGGRYVKNCKNVNKDGNIT